MRGINRGCVIHISHTGLALERGIPVWMWKKMEVGDLYKLVLAIVMIALILGTGILLLGKFMEANNMSAAANTSLTASINALAPIGSSWLPLVVTIAALSIVLSLVLSAFQNR